MALKAWASARTGGGPCSRTRTGVHHGAHRAGAAADHHQHGDEHERADQERQRCQSDTGRTVEAGALGQQPAGRCQAQAGHDDQADQTNHDATEEAGAGVRLHQNDGVRRCRDAASPPRRPVLAGIVSHTSVNR